jgi:hypothetical protein
VLSPDRPKLDKTPSQLIHERSRLAQIEEVILATDQRITLQRDRIERSKAAGKDVRFPARVLANMEARLRAMRSARSRIIRDLSSD